ncbi:hypothetical protein [Bradyrhizobium sp. WD16]|uniref:hypothetical protein n=1 Tax=Bradyrhizobium sp. WD16 TaxID=1521768 RepID=UPI0020A3CD35|nr:hypothetical protein [Bradyrhizobium sp. WD16]
MPLVDGALFRWRIPDARSVESVVGELVADGSARAAQPNYRFVLQRAVGRARAIPPNMHWPACGCPRRISWPAAIA